MMQLDRTTHTWLGLKPVQHIFAAFPKDSVRFVGGCVRNALLGVAVADFDLATTLEPPAVIAALKKAKIPVYETGLAHGTVTAIVSGQVFEITSLREDIRTDGRRAIVGFTQDWQVDALRRDFTMNALYADLAGKIYDPTGQGLDDLKARRIRFVGEAKLRIEEDYLRILRFFRFSAWYGDDRPMDKAALEACRELKHGLKTLSAERIWAEVKKLLCAPTPQRTVNVMQISGILESILPEASNSEGLQLLCTLEKQAGLTPDPYLRLMAMSARDEFAMAGLCKRLKMSKKEKSRLLLWAGDQTKLAPGLSEKALAIALYHTGHQVAVDRAILRAAGASDSDVRRDWLAIYTAASVWQRPVFPLRGKDLIKAGVASGPKVGKALAALEALWVRSGFKANKQALLAALVLINR